MIVLSNRLRENWRQAYEWHRGFANSNCYIFPRRSDEFEHYAYDKKLWCARNLADGPFVGLAYCTREALKWEIGGLVVAEDHQKNGLGSTIAHVTLGHLLYTEDPLAVAHEVVTCVHVDNRHVVRPLIQQLRLRKTGPINKPQFLLPGLPSDGDGMVHGDEFALVNPDTLLVLADWCEKWEGTLEDGTPVEIILERATFAMWARAFRDMASS